MVQLVLSLALVFVIIILPVMIAARMVGAGRTSFWPVVFAVLLQVLFGVLIRLVIENELLLGFTSAVGGSLIYSFALKTTILRGFAISLLAVGIVVVALLLLTGVASVLGL